METDGRRPPQSASRSTRISLNPDFEPWKLKPDEIKRWEKLPVSIVERY